MQILIVDPFSILRVVEHQPLLVELLFLFGFKLSCENREVPLEIFSVILEHVVVPLEGSPNRVEATDSVSCKNVVSAIDTPLMLRVNVQRGWRVGGRV